MSSSFSGVRARMAGLLAAVALAVTGCGGGSNQGVVMSVSGTAATGAPIDGMVMAIGALGRVASTQTAADGKFTINTTGLTPPILIKVVPGAGQPIHYSYSATAGATTVNVTPLTSTALYLALGKKPLGALFDSWGTRNGELTAGAINQAQRVLNKNLQPEFQARGLDYRTYDFFSSPFDADRTGFDAVLDGLNVQVPSDDTGSLTFDVPGRNGFTLDEAIDISDVTITPPAGGGGAPAANETPATIPAHAAGTFNWTFDDGPNATPLYNDGDMVSFLVGTDGSLTFNGTTLNNPVLRNGNPHEAIWKDTTNGVEYALSSIANAPNPPVEINISADGTFNTFFGQFNDPAAAGGGGPGAPGGPGGGTPPPATPTDVSVNLSNALLSITNPRGRLGEDLDDSGNLAVFSHPTGVFLRNISAGTTSRVDVNNAGTTGDGATNGAVKMSGDGMTIAFESSSRNLAGNPVFGAQLYVKNMSTGVIQWVNSNETAATSHNILAVSNDHVIWQGNSTGKTQKFDLATGTNTEVMLPATMATPMPLSQWIRDASRDGTVFLIRNRSASVFGFPIGALVVYDGTNYRCASLDPDGTCKDPDKQQGAFTAQDHYRLSDNGAVVVFGAGPQFHSTHGTSSFVYKYELANQMVALVSLTNGQTPHVAGDGGQVVVGDLLDNEIGLNFTGSHQLRFKAPGRAIEIAPTP